MTFPENTCIVITAGAGKATYTVADCEGGETPEPTPSGDALVSYEIVDKVNWSVDQFVLGAVSGTIAVSLYSVASQLNTLFINLSTISRGFPSITIPAIVLSAPFISKFVT